MTLGLGVRGRNPGGDCLPEVEDAMLSSTLQSVQNVGRRRGKGGGSWERARAEAEVANKMFEPAKTSFLCVCP